jgi:hypothetical protein
MRKKQVHIIPKLGFSPKNTCGLQVCFCKCLWEFVTLFPYFTWDQKVFG